MTVYCILKLQLHEETRTNLIFGIELTICASMLLQNSLEEFEQTLDACAKNVFAEGAEKVKKI